MRIKKIDPNHLTNCPYCKKKDEKVKAVWHLTGENKQACDKHLIELKQLQTLHVASEGGYLDTDYSEADHQTWLRY